MAEIKDQVMSEEDFFEMLKILDKDDIIHEATFISRYNPETGEREVIVKSLNYGD